MRELGRTRSAVRHVAWLDGGRKLLAVTQLYSLVTFDVASGTRFHATSPAGSAPGAPLRAPFLSIHPDGTRFATADDADPRFYPQTPAQLWALTDSRLTYGALPRSANLHGGLAFTPDGSALVGGAACRATDANTFVGEIVWWDLARGAAGTGFAGHAGLTAALAFTADGAHLVSWGGDDYFRVWDVASRKEIASRKARNRHRSIALAPDGRGLAFAHDYRGGIMLLDPLANKKLGKPREVRAHEHHVTGVAYSPANDRIASVGTDRRLCLWARDGSPVREFLHGGTWLTCVAFAPDGQTVAAGDEQGLIVVYDVD